MKRWACVPVFLFGLALPAVEDNAVEPPIPKRLDEVWTPGTMIPSGHGWSTIYEMGVVTYPPDKPKEEAIPPPPIPASEYVYTTIHKSRDQINLDRMRSSKYVISLDFNKYKKKTQCLVVIKNNPPKELVTASREFIRRVCEVYGCSVCQGGRYGPGIRTTRENKRGISGIVHIEAFDGNDTAMFRQIQNDPYTYSKILADTYGRLSKSVFIAPHTRSAQGARGPGGISERAFALRYVLPNLDAIKTGGKPVRVARKK